MLDESHTFIIGNDYGPIIGVAIKFDGKIWALPKPNRHHHVIRMIAKENGVGINGPDIQGFYDCHGQFLDRREAMHVAKHFNQLHRKSGPGTYQGDELFSEDLW